ncbi:MULTISPECIES: T9SS type A sorting domain-containing protein [Flavobacterium]|uniref:T9SS type A sorting domain-containing protein n=1 Tax=Flavobacterium TaxID=237 RepID=UPI001FCC9CF7|nr:MULTISPECIES: T9SS type A sorting domain-containing protein [Flavobacterium]UOK43677.1 T9SS type A sorting domain-containing protein [Flavobacterium enshiense]
MEKNCSSLVLGVLLTVFTSVTGMAQVTTNGGSGLNAAYPDLATAITALNGATITSPVVITLTGNETAPAGGYVITAEGTAVNTITITGTGYTITASGALTAGSLSDAIFKFQGADFTTLQGFTMLENPANITTAEGTNNMTEWGVALLYASTTNGCQNVTIQNNTIDLYRMYQNSFGIYSNSTHNATAPTSGASASGATGGNHNLKIYGNTITDVNNPIVVVGPSAAADHNDGLDIGGNSAATGNALTNFGNTGSFSAFSTVSQSQVAGVQIKNSKNINVSYNTITSSDGGTTSGILRGIYLPTNTNAVTGTFTNSFTNNTVSLRVGAALSGISGIMLEGSTVTNTSTLNITDNDFVNCGHTTATATGGITLISNQAAALNTNINYNEFMNLNIISTGAFTFIYNSGARPAGAVTNVNGNKITGTFTRPNSGGATSFYMNTTNSANGAVENNLNNDFSNITINGGTSITGWISKDGATAAPFGPAKTVTGNTFRNITGGTGSIVILSVANSNGATVNSVSGNVISNINTTTGAVTAIDLANGNQSVSGNTISGINTTTGAVKGITTANGSNRIFGNTLEAFKGTDMATVYGIEFVEGIHAIYKNKIYNLESGTGTPAGTTVIGIVGGSSTIAGQHDIYNNIIGDLRSSANFANAIVGINIGGSGTANVYNNTVVLNAIAPAVANFGSAALFAGQYVVITMKNNVLVNTSGFAGTGKTVAYRRNVNLTNYVAGSNNNLLYASTIYFDGTNADTTIDAYKARTAPRESLSVSENPSFVSMVGTSPDFLHVNTTVATQIEGGGTNVALVTEDFDGNIRHASTPDIGADEFTGVPLDLTKPVITLTADTTCSIGTRTVSATITDASGIPTAGTGLPVAYWRINSGAYTAATGISMGAGVYNFTIGTGSVAGDFLSYYVVAQDAATTPNVSVSPSTGAAGLTANPPAAGTAPTAPTALVTPLNGVYTVGTGGNYTTLTAAVAAYNSRCLAGAVTFSLLDATYSASETFPITIQQHADASAVNTLTVKPAAGIAPTITGSSTSAIVKLNGADYVTIDGSNNGTNTKDLTIANTSNSTLATVVWLASSATTGATNNTIKNSVVKGQGTTTTRSAIITSGSTVSAVAEIANSGNKFQNNAISLAKNGIEILGPVAIQSGTVISGNSIGAAGTTLGISGVSLMNEMGTVVDNNTIQGILSVNILPSPFTKVGGILLLANTSGVVMSNNTIKNIKSIANLTGDNSVAGVIVPAGNTDAIIKGNVITDIGNNSTGAYGVRGIIILGNGTAITNNMISDIYNAQGSVLGSASTIGVAIGGTAANVSLINNTVHLFGTRAGNAANTTSGMASCIFLETSGTGLDIRNNILVNTYDNTASTGDKSYAVYSMASGNTQFAAIDYNDYYVAGSGTPVLGYLNGDKATFADFVTAFGGNTNSANVLPVFTFNNDLHLVPASNSALDNLGTPVAAVTTDIDGQTRSASTPDMGADEFSSVCAAAVGGTSTPTAATLCTSGSTTISATGYTTGTGITYQWESASDAAFTTPVNEGVSTAVYANLTTPTITATTYYRLKVTCSAGMSGYSSVSTVTVNTTPAPVGPSTQTISGGVPSEATIEDLTPNGPGIVWYPTSADALAGTNAIVANTQLTSGSVYYAMQTEGGCRSTSYLAVTVTVTLGVNDFSLSNLKVYPNPVNDVLQIENPQSITNVEMYSITGQMVLSKSVNAMMATIPVSGFAAGTYFVKVSTDDAVKTIKVIKKQ